MSDESTIREWSSKSQKQRCVICGSTVDVERHHVGGQNHVSWFTIPLCRNHHVLLTAMIRRADVNMRYTPDKRVRIVRALMATTVFIWLLLKNLLQEFEEERKQQ